MSDGEQEKMAGAAEGTLPKETSPKHESKLLPKGASHEESSEIQQLVNILSQALNRAWWSLAKRNPGRTYELCVFIQWVKISKHVLFDPMLTLQTFK